MTAAALNELHCPKCGKRREDYVNGIKDGHVILRWRCRGCKAMVEVMIEKS
jgi:transposase-like protein